MILFKKALEIEEFIGRQKELGKIIGFVPTMGALHDGHISLLKTCINLSDISICSIFVNPTQFNNQQDFQKYPVNISDDIIKLEEEGCDVLFLPPVEEVYPNGLTSIHYNFGNLEHILEGEYRPGHFQGVGQVVHRLLNIIQPDKIFLGQKDYQQCFIIKKLVELEKIPVKVYVEETLREASGLAMSSRNLRLSEAEKKSAAAINQSLLIVKENLSKRSIPELIKFARKHLLENGFSKVDYISIANAKTLQSINVWDTTTPLVALVAAYIGEVRLIDNLVLTPSLF
jgi:pantoate--beta-alanine ligase